MARPGAGQLNAATHHVIDITGSSEASISTTNVHFSGGDFGATAQNEDAPSVAAELPVTRPSRLSGGPNTRNSSLVRRGNGRRQRSPSDFGLLVFIELFLTLCQIVASVIVLCLSRDEHPDTTLYVWIVGYAIGCVVSLPILYLRYHFSLYAGEQGSTHSRQNPPQINDPSRTIVSTSSSGGDVQAAAESSRSNPTSIMMSARLKPVMNRFKIALDCFFAVWFVVGVVWVFGGHSSADNAPNLYRLCVVFLSISFIGYATPFILCATICCCLPCIITFLGVREEAPQTRGATSESIDALPTYTFKMKKNKSRDGSNSANNEGGIVAAGTEKEQIISGEDAVCCICLADYENNEKLRELPCSHLFHKDCVDKWLKINALCPLCKCEAGETGSVSVSVSVEGSNQQRDENRRV